MNHFNRTARLQAARRTEHSYIWHTWDHNKSLWCNLAKDPNKAVPLCKKRWCHGEASGEALCAKWPGGRSQPPRKGNTLSGLHRLCRLATWWRTMGRTYKTISPRMRIIIIETHRDRFGIRSASLSIFIQLSDKPSVILCRRIRWRLNDWFISASGWGLLLDPSNWSQSLRQGRVCGYR